MGSLFSGYRRARRTCRIRPTWSGRRGPCRLDPGHKGPCRPWGAGQARRRYQAA